MHKEVSSLKHAGDMWQSPRQCTHDLLSLINFSQHETQKIDFFFVDCEICLQTALLFFDGCSKTIPEF